MRLRHAKRRLDMRAPHEAVLGDELQQQVIALGQAQPPAPVALGNGLHTITSPRRPSLALA